MRKSTAAFSILMILCVVDLAEAAISNVKVLSTTPTQAVLQYEAPVDAPCSLEVSESAVFTPLVPDVDPLLFPGAALDSREGNIVSGRFRIFVIGRHGMSYRGGVNPFLAGDGRVYSRALQAYTTHYFRVTCGAEQAAGSFQTANMPLGQTFSEPVPTGPAGQYNFPTWVDDRNQQVVDPNTGALVRRITLPGDVGPSVLASWFSGGFHDWCSPVLSNAGYHCVVPSLDGNANALYWIKPDTGEVRFLGHMSYSGQYGEDGWSAGWAIASAMWDATDPNAYYVVQDGNHADPVNAYLHKVVLKWTYTGNDVAVAKGQRAPNLVTNLTPPTSSGGSLNDRIAAFAPSFDKRLFYRVGGTSVQGSYLLLMALRYQQDSFGWLAALDLSTGRVVAAVDVVRHPRTRWCGIHSVAPVGNQPVYHWQAQSLTGNTATGPWQTNLTAPVTSPDQTVIAVAGDPVCTNSSTVDCKGTTSGPDHDFLMSAEVGDLMRIGSERVRIVQKISSTSWVVARGLFGSEATPHELGSTATAVCNALGDNGYGEGFWMFLNDPTGADTANIAYVVDNQMAGAHYVTRGEYRIMAGWQVIAGALPSSLGKPVSFGLTASPSFAGTAALAEGLSFDKHPSYHNADSSDPVRRQWFLDQLPFIGGNLHSANPGVAPIIGSLYLYFPAQNIPLLPKTHPLFGVSLQTPFTDVSGPASHLGGGTEDSYKYCVVRRAGECYPGSIPDQIYVNVPNLTLPYCGGSEWGPSASDVCIGSFATYGMAVVQLGLEPANHLGTKVYPVYGAGKSRVITNALSAYRALSAFANAKALPDGSWTGFMVASGGAAPRQAMLVKLPPYTPASTQPDLSTFVEIPISVTDVSAQFPSVSNVVIEFGYAENGSPGSFFCTQRQESCVKGGQPAGDFAFAGDPVVGVACAKGCTVTLPTLPGRIPYYRVVYRDGGNQVLANSALQVGYPGSNSTGTIGQPTAPRNVRVIR